jgi:hypothetical protein
MTHPVSTFGGYRGRALDIVPDRCGLLTFVVEGRPSKLRLFWSFDPKGGVFPLGEIAFPGTTPGERVRR